MKADFSSPIRDLDGNPIEDAGKPVTLGSLSINALLGVLFVNGNQPENLDGIAKVANASLAQQIHNGGTIDLTAERIALLKERIGRMYSPLFVMQAWELLDPAE